MRMSTTMRAALYGLLFSMVLLHNGCASRSAAHASTAPKGVLMDWDSQPLGVDESPKEYLEGLATIFSGMPADVVVETKTDQQLVLTMDMAKAGRAIAPKADPNDTETAPTRCVWRIADVDGKRTVESRRYYIGKDEKVIAACHKNVEHKAKATGQQPPKD
jgi:hypothetical protein